MSTQYRTLSRCKRAVINVQGSQKQLREVTTICSALLCHCVSSLVGGRRCSMGKYCLHRRG